MGATKLTCRECGADYGLEARYVCDRCFGPLEVAYEHDIRRRRARAPAHPGRAAEHLALRTTSCRWRARSRAPAPACPPAARRSSAPIAWPRASACARCGSRTTRPTPRTPSRTAWSRSPPRAPASSASRRSPAPRPATSPTRSPPTAPRSAWTPTSSSRPTSRSRRSSPPASTGRRSSRSRATTTTSTASAPSSRGERDWAFVNVNVRPYYAEGSKTLALRDRRAARLGGARPRRGADRLRLAVHEDRQGLPGLPRPRPRARPAADHERRAGRRLLAGGQGLRRRRRLLQAGATRHDRQVAGHRQPGRRALRARARAAQRRLASTRSPTTRSAPASACWPRRPASSPRPPAA